MAGFSVLRHRAAAYSDNTLPGPYVEQQRSCISSPRLVLHRTTLKETGTAISGRRIHVRCLGSSEQGVSLCMLCMLSCALVPRDAALLRIFQVQEAEQGHSEAGKKPPTAENTCPSFIDLARPKLSEHLINTERTGSSSRSRTQSV